MFFIGTFWDFSYRSGFLYSILKFYSNYWFSANGILELQKCSDCLTICVSVLSLQELCRRAITAHTTIYGVDHLPLPSSLKAHLRSYLLDNRTHTTRMPSFHRDRHARRKIIHPSDSPTNSRSPCCISWKTAVFGNQGLRVPGISEENGQVFRRLLEACSSESWIQWSWFDCNGTFLSATRSDCRHSVRCAVFLVAQNNLLLCR